MTTTQGQARKTAIIRLPDPPDPEPGDMTSSQQLSVTGATYHLIRHLGHPESTVVDEQHYLAPTAPRRTMAGTRYPDLLVAFGVDPAYYQARNAYIIDEMGKPPDFILEIASDGTWRVDAGVKRQHYQELGVREYWRFDGNGDDRHRARLAGDRLVNGQYRPVEIHPAGPGDVLEGYSPALNLRLRWQDAMLLWIDPETGLPIPTYDDAMELLAQSRAEIADERRARSRAEARSRVAEAQNRSEREARNRAETRNRELEAEIRRLREQSPG